METSPKTKRSPFNKVNSHISTFSGGHDHLKEMNRLLLRAHRNDVQAKKIEEEKTSNTLFIQNWWKD